MVNGLGTVVSLALSTDSVDDQTTKALRRADMEQKASQTPALG